MNYPQNLIGGWGLSFKKANRQLPALLKVLFHLLLFFLKDFLFLAALVILGIVFRSHAYGLALIGIAVLLLFWFAAKFNGAIGMATCLLSAGENEPAQIAKLSYEKSWEFFRNGWNTGVVLLFGQLLLVCPCFLVMNNFLFSPYLFVYENVKGAAAKKRSKDLAAGFGWYVLNRTAAVMLLGYAFLIFFGLLLLSGRLGLALLLAAVSGIYFSLIQANFIREVYLQTIEMQRQGVQVSSGRYKFFTALIILAVIAVYLGIKLSSHYL